MAFCLLFCWMIFCWVLAFEFKICFFSVVSFKSTMFSITSWVILTFSTLQKTLNIMAAVKLNFQQTVQSLINTSTYLVIIRWHMWLLITFVIWNKSILFILVILGKQSRAIIALLFSKVHRLVLSLCILIKCQWWIFSYQYGYAIVMEFLYWRNLSFTHWIWVIAPSTLDIKS